MHKFTSNIPLIVNNISTMQDVSAQNMDLSGSLDVSQNTTIGGTLSVIGNETVGGTLGVTNTTTLTGNVGIGGASGSHNLLVTGSERITGNLDVSGDLTVTGNFNFNEIIQNITTVNNEVIISTQLDISNQGTGPALKVSQFGVGEDQDVAVFNAGDEGDAFKIDYAGNSHFYKEVDIVKEYDDVSFDTILIRRTNSTSKYIFIRTLQVYVNNSNILPSATNATTSVGSGSIGDVIEFITWNDLVVRNSFNNNIPEHYASNIRENDVGNPTSIHSTNPSYNSLYIPLIQSFNISDVQSFVLYNRNLDSYFLTEINGFQIELYNRSNGFTPGSNVLYTMPINTSEYVYRYDLPSISSYSGGFSSVDSQTQIKTVTVSNSDENFNATLLKVEGGNVAFGGGFSVTGNTTLSRLEMRQEKFDTILIRRTNSTSKYIYIRTLQVYVNNSNILPSATNATTSVGSGSIGDVIEFITWNDLVVRNSFINNSPEYYASNIRESDVGNHTSIHSTNPSYNSLYIPLIQSFNISDVQSFVLYNRNLSGDFLKDINGFQIELYNRSNGFTPGSNVLYTMPINTSAYVYRFDLPSISSYTGFSSVDSQTQIKNITVSASSQNLETTSFKVEDGNTEVGGDLRVGGDLIVEDGNTEVGGDLRVGGDFIVDGSFNITGTIDSGNITGRTGSTITAPTITASGNLFYGSNNVGTKISTIETSLSGKQSTLNSTSTNIQTGTIDSGNITGRTGTTITAPTITASGNLYVGQNTNDSSTKSIFFGGGFGDNTYDHAVIENRIYEATEQSELLLFKGNDAIGGGPDRIRLRAGAIAFDTYTAATTTRTDENIRMTILSNGNVGIGTVSPLRALQVVGDIYCTGNISCEGYMKADDKPIMLIHRHDFTLPTGTTSLLNGGTVSLQSNCTVSSGIFIATIAGIYACSCKVRLQDNNTQTAEIQWYRRASNGSQSAYENLEMWIPAGSTGGRRAGMSHTIISLAVGEGVLPRSDNPTIPNCTATFDVFMIQ